LYSYKSTELQAFIKCNHRAVKNAQSNLLSDTSVYVNELHLRIIISLLIAVRHNLLRIRTTAQKLSRNVSHRIKSYYISIRWFFCWCFSSLAVCVWSLNNARTFSSVVFSVLWLCRRLESTADKLGR